MWRTQDLRWVGLFAALSLAWGLNYPIVRVGLSESAPLWLAAFRSLVGLAALSGYFLLGGRRTLDRRGRRDALLVGLPTTALFFGLWFVAAGQVPPGTAAVLVYTFPLWVALLTGPMTGGRISPRSWIPILAGFLGVILVSEPWATGNSGLDPLPLGELLAAAAAWAVGTIWFKQRFAGTQMLKANIFQLASGAATLVVAAAVLEPTGPVVAGFTLLDAVVYMGVFGTAFGYAAWFALLNRFPAPTISAYLFLVPVVALTFSVTFFGERIGFVQLAGALLVLGAIYGVARTGGEPQRNRRGGATGSGAPPSDPGRNPRSPAD